MEPSGARAEEDMRSEKEEEGKAGEWQTEEKTEGEERHCLCVLEEQFGPLKWPESEMCEGAGVHMCECVLLPALIVWKEFGCHDWKASLLKLFKPLMEFVITGSSENYIY